MVAADRGDPPLWADVDVELDVVDRNNKPPLWDLSVYGPIYLKENVTVGTVVTSVKARWVPPPPAHTFLCPTPFWCEHFCDEHYGEKSTFQNPKKRIQFDLVTAIFSSNRTALWKIRISKRKLSEKFVLVTRCSSSS